MIIVKDLHKSFGEKKVLDGFNASFEIGKVTCVMGESGGGKTTLLNLIMGLLKPDAGEISGVPNKISAVFQEDRLCEPYSAVRNVLAVTGHSVAEDDIVALLRELRLEGSEYLPVNTL
ncbi:MAG: ATP-binding cassette domain-containing protein, partial [Clostridia bacterium]|nr:ATP-binding cassette domain-containing protein [Clostridia bacterium]